MQFPRMVYKKGPGLALPRGESVSCKAVLDEDAYDEALDADWFPSVPEALIAELGPPVEESKVKVEEHKVKVPELKRPQLINTGAGTASRK